MSKEDLGFLSDANKQKASHISKDVALEFLSSPLVSKRSIGAYYFTLCYQDEDALLLIPFYKTESKLYPRLYLQEAFQKGAQNTVFQLIKHIGTLNNNQYQEMPSISKKRTYPLPRDVFSRIIAHLNPIYFYDVFSNYKSESLIIKRELLDALGFLCYHNQELQIDANYNFFKDLLQSTDQIIIAKAIIALSAFKTIENIEFLQNLSFFPQYREHILQIKRSLNMIETKTLIQLKNITVICASKYFDLSELHALYKKGLRNFGENRVELFLDKYEKFKKKGVVWHFIGHLQRNKAKEVINKIDVLHSLDSLELAKLINETSNKVLDVFIQVNIIGEIQKSGVLPTKLATFIDSIKKYDKLNVVGLMAMGKADDALATKEVFLKLDILKTEFSLKKLSIGMTEDYLLALKCHATHLRIGSLFKGEL